MKIDFIKWMVKYAEGFRYKHGAEYGDLLWFEDVNCGLHTTIYQKIWIPLLLQRAIEGINRYTNPEICYQTRIYQSDESIKISFVPDRTQIQKTEHFWIKNDPDHAKEQALKYIWEQEKKS